MGHRLGCSELRLIPQFAIIVGEAKEVQPKAPPQSVHLSAAQKKVPASPTHEAGTELMKKTNQTRIASPN
jgi:hypothetical protein